MTQDKLPVMELQGCDGCDELTSALAQLATMTAERDALREESKRELLKKIDLLAAKEAAENTITQLQIDNTYWQDRTEQAESKVDELEKTSYLPLISDFKVCYSCKFFPTDAMGYQYVACRFNDTPLKIESVNGFGKTAYKNCSCPRFGENAVSNLTILELLLLLKRKPLPR